MKGRAATGLGFFVEVTPVTMGPPNPLGAARRGRLRASDADREHVIEMLKAAFVQGRLTKDELDLRVGQAFVSRTYAELAALTADIPVGSALVPRPKPVPVPARQARRPANKKANTWALVVVAHIPVAMIVVAAIIGSDGLAQAAAPMLYAYFWFVMIAVAHLIDSQLKKRARPPMPGAGTARLGHRPS